MVWAISLLVVTCLAVPSLSLRHAFAPEDVFRSSQDSSLREVFQVYPPPISPKDLVGSTVCSFTLMNHVFGNSAGKPFIGTYEPLCGPDWDVAVLNLSVVSYGRQFDRLGSVWIGNTEVWRTCTAEPVWSGIHYTFSKDISAFKALIRSSQPLAVDIGNYVVGPYNGSFNATLSVNFYNLQSPLPQAAADEIIPLSKQSQQGVATYFSLPDDSATTSVFIPNNSSRLVIDVLASGNGEEEFWYSNIPDDYVETFQQWNDSFLGQGSFREVVVLVDHEPVGVVSPFEAVFTGGICFGFWRRIVGHRTFDLPSYRVDMTPFIPILRNGTHLIQFCVRGQPKTLQNWYVSGRLHLWFSNSSTYTASPSPLSSSHFISPTANLTAVGHVGSGNTSFSVNTTASRQDPSYYMEYNNLQFYQLHANGSVLCQSVSQTTSFVSPLSRGYYSLALEVSEQTHPNGSIYILASLSQLYHRNSTDILHGFDVIEHAEVAATGVLSIDGNKGWSLGNTSVRLTYDSPRREYVRDVKVIGVQVVSDYEIDKSVGSFLLQIPGS